MYEIMNYEGWPDCVRLYNEGVEVIAATVIGCRILRAGFINGQNFFYLSPEDAGKTGGDDWRIYGGHRLWHAPEAIPRSYYPDNRPVEYFLRDNTLTLRQEREETTGIIKEMEIVLHPSANELTITHRLINKNLWPVSLSPWAISAMAPGGLAIVPQEPFGEGDEYLLPARPLILWSYARMQDPRWFWGNEYILGAQDPNENSEQKIGVLNKQGWCAYSLNGELFLKRFSYAPGRQYPDFNSNNEIYINRHFLEIETLGPMEDIAPGEAVAHTEHWLISKATSDNVEEVIGRQILPMTQSFL
ncbi:MAG: hypothetical protein JNL51_07725 [Chitinophagaceae bacterium]|nr:hypothetical protein [Chitinophagaceae bacterium]